MSADWDGKWWTGTMRCRLCGHEQTSVVPVRDEDDDVLTRCECANCGNMTAEAAGGSVGEAGVA